MQLKIFTLMLVVLTASLVACGGGGTGSVNPPTSGNAPGAGPPPGSAPTTAPTTDPSDPPTSFVDSGTLTRSDFYNYPATDPLPASTVTAQVAQNTVISTVANPFGSGNVLDYHTAENDAYALQTLPFTTDAFLRVNSAVSPSELVLLGSKVVDDQGSKTLTTFDLPQILDKIPQAASQMWTNNPGSRIDIDYVNGNTSDRHVGSDGTSSEQDFIVNIDGKTPHYPTVQVTAQTQFDGSAKVVFLLDEEGRPGFPFSSITDTFTMSKPGASGIVLSFAQNSVPVTGTPPPISTPAPFAAAPAWFKPPLFSETDVDNGLTTIPSACKVSSSFGKQAFQIVQKKHAADGAFGFVDDTTTTAYVVHGFGPVCVRISDVNNAFYDYAQSDFLNQAPGNFFDFAVSTAQPLIATTITEQLTLQSAPSGVSPQSESTQIKPIPYRAITLAQLEVQRQAHAARIKRLFDNLERIQRAMLGGGKVL